MFCFRKMNLEGVGYKNGTVHTHTLKKMDFLSFGESVFKKKWGVWMGFWGISVKKKGEVWMGF